MMNKKIKTIIIITFLLFTFFYTKNCYAANIATTGVNIKQSYVLVFSRKYYQLNATVSPTNATNKKITWSSSNTNIVKVSSTGKVYGIKPGKAKITAKTPNGKKDTCTIAVSVPAKSIKLNKTYLKMPSGRMVQLTVSFNPVSTTCKGITWKSSNPNVVSITYTNKPIATLNLKNQGTATITATSKYGLKASCFVRVANKSLNKPAGFTQKNYKGMPYYQSIPKNATENMPLIIFLHGDGEVNKFNKLGTLPMVQYVKSNQAYKAGKFIFIAPMRKTSTWLSSNTEKTLMELIKKIVNDYKIDKNSIILTGMSSGGQETWHLAGKYQHYFSAIVPMSAKTTYAKAEKLVNLPIWGICGNTKDQEPERNRQMRVLIAKINKLNGSKKLIKFETINGATHGSIQQAFKRQALFKWMLEQRKN